MQAFGVPPATASEDGEGGSSVRPPGSDSAVAGARRGPLQTASPGPPPPENGGGFGPRASSRSPESSPGPEEVEVEAEEDNDDGQQQEEEHDELRADLTHRAGGSLKETELQQLGRELCA